ncbi:MAG TPA: 2OG-Fe(II) oxygenase [Polyangiaceae bacterium]|nr:2OG-Fe(II) oxygenase [Polyangiaceae bacterium]
MRASFSERARAVAWPSVVESLEQQGAALIPALLTPEECAELMALYADSERFRSKVVMQRHGYGRGEYQYFDYPLPPLVGALREQMYSALVPLANRWHEALGLETRFPDALADFSARCHAAGQARPTPLLLRYEAGDYNCLHQDLYGEHVFPLQLAVLLSKPLDDFEGGELVLTEQRPRMQSRPMVLTPRQGDAVVFAVRHRPLQGTRGVYRVQMRHGVSRILRGERYTLGIIFHDAT